MIVVDTNVLSEALRTRPAQRVLEWLDSEPLQSLFTTTITEAELLFGIALLPPGRRRDALEVVITRILSERFSARILAFDRAAAREFADIAAGRRRLGRPIGEADTRIAAIARSWGARLATRNITDFEECGVELINPWG